MIRPRKTYPLLAAALVSGALALGGCAGRSFEGFPAPSAEAPAWPPPPLRARVAHVMDIRRHQDLYDEAGFWNGVARIVAGPADSTLVKPFAVAVHPGGGLLISDPGRACVHFYDWDGREYTILGGDLQGGLPSPVGIAVLPEGDILVSDSRRGSVERFSRGGSHIGAFTQPGTLQRPAGIVYHPAREEIMVADVLGHDIAVFDREGRLIRRMGERGAESGRFNYPTHLALDSRGRLLVTDSMNFRIQLIESDGTPVRSFGRLGDAPGHFSKPKGVAVDGDDHLIAVEGLYDTLQFFSLEGRLLLSMGSPGGGPGEFWLPNGVTVDRERGLLFVADSYNARIQVFRLLQEMAPE